MNINQKQKISGYLSKMFLKLWKKKILFLTGFEPGTFQLWGLHSTKKPLRLVAVKWYFLMVFKERACNQKIFVQPTSLFGQLGEKQPIFPCSNSIFSEDAQKCTKISPLSPSFGQIQRFYQGQRVDLRRSKEIFCWVQIRLNLLLNCNILCQKSGAFSSFFAQFPTP